MNPLWQMVRFTWHEAKARRLLLAVLVLSAVFLGFYFLGVQFLLDSFQRRAAQLGRSLNPEQLVVPTAVLVLMGLYIVNFLGSLISVFTTIASLSGEVDSGTVQSVLPKPLRRQEWVLGKWLGHSSLVLPYVLLLAVGMLLGSFALTGYAPPNPLPALALMLLSALFLLSLSLLASSLFSTLTAGVVLFMAYGLGWIGGILASVGSLTRSPSLEAFGQFTSYLMPADALWRGASYYLQPPIMLQAQEAARGNPFVGTEPIAAGYLIWVGVYTVLLVAATVWVVRRRDF